MLVEGLQEQLVLTDVGAAVDWLEATIKARYSLQNALGGQVQEKLAEVVNLAQRYFQAAARDAQRPLPFIFQDALRRVAEDDWTRMLAAAQREDAKTAAIAGGSTVEGIALDILERLDAAAVQRLRDHLNGLPPDRRRNLNEKSGPAADWSFAFLLLSMGPEGLGVLSGRTHEVGHRLRDWRNFVHPGRSRKEPPLSAADGRLAAAFCEKVVEEAVQWHQAGAVIKIP